MFQRAGRRLVVAEFGQVDPEEVRILVALLQFSLEMLAARLVERYFQPFGRLRGAIEVELREQGLALPGGESNGRFHKNGRRVVHLELDAVEEASCRGVHGEGDLGHVRATAVLLALGGDHAHHVDAFHLLAVHLGISGAGDGDQFRQVRPVDGITVRGDFLDARAHLDGRVVQYQRVPEVFPDNHLVGTDAFFFLFFLILVVGFVGLFFLFLLFLLVAVLDDPPAHVGPGRNQEDFPRDVTPVVFAGIFRGGLDVHFFHEGLAVEAVVVAGGDRVIILVSRIGHRVGGTEIVAAADAGADGDDQGPGPVRQEILHAFFLRLALERVEGAGIASIAGRDRHFLVFPHGLIDKAAALHPFLGIH